MVWFHPALLSFLLFYLLFSLLVAFLFSFYVLMFSAIVVEAIYLPNESPNEKQEIQI